MTYQEALIKTILEEPEFVKEFDRLTNSNLSDCVSSLKKGGLNLEIDKATGRLASEILKFDMFFYEFIWSRLPEEAFKA